MTVQYSVVHQNNQVQDIATQLGAGGYISFYSGTGTMPAHCATAPTGTLLASLALANPGGTATGGVFTLGVVTAGTANPAGSVSYYRLCTASAGTAAAVVAQGTVQVSGGDLTFAGGITWTLGETVGITSLTITANGA